MAALQNSIQTIKEISFYGANWNSNEAIETLIKFIATAPKLWFCGIQNKTNSPKFRVERQKAENGGKGYVKAIKKDTREVIYEVETAFS